jgi:3-hydroxybutyryl-CoA dehydrogenase
MTKLVNVAIVGGGYMGTGIAQVLALAGHECQISDIDFDTAHAAVERCIRDAEELEAIGAHAAGAAHQIAARLTPAVLADAVADAGFIVEAVPEERALKTRVLAAIEHAAPLHATIASNTSAIPITLMAEELSYPGRFLGCHWFNPAPLVPCVEVIPHERTERAVTETAARCLAAAGKRPTVVGDGPGFVANRLQFALFREAAAVVADQVASPEAVDAVVRASFGYRLPFLGPFAVADMAGLDVYAGAYDSLRSGLGDDHGAPESLRALVDQGRLGTKSGGGYLPLTSEQAAALKRWRDRAYTELATLLDQMGEPDLE